MEHKPEGYWFNKATVIFIALCFGWAAWELGPDLFSIIFKKRDLPVGRYAIASTSSQLVMVDTRTAQLYYWDGKWTPFEDSALIQENTFTGDMKKFIHRQEKKP